MKKLVFLVFLLAVTIAGFSQTTIVNGLQVKGLQGSASGQAPSNKSGLAVFDSTGKIMKLTNLAAIGARVRQVNKISDTVLQFVTDSAVYTLLVRGGLSPFRQAKLDSLIAGLLFDSTYVSNTPGGTTQLVYISSNGDTVKGKSLKDSTVKSITGPDSLVRLYVAPTGITPGIYGSSTQIPVMNLGADGRVNGITLATPTGGAGGSVVKKTPQIIASNYTLVAADSNTYLISTAATPITVTIPTNGTSGLPVFMGISIFQYGAGKVTVAPAGSVTLAGPGGKLRTAGQYAKITVDEIQSSVWITSGELDTTTAPFTSSSVSSVSGFISNSGSVSPSQSFSLFGSNLTGNLTVTAPTNFLVSLDNTTFLTSVPVTPASGSVSQLIYVEIASTAPVGAVSGNVGTTGGGSTLLNVGLSGTVTNNTAALSVSTTSITGLNTTGGIPGTAQTFTATFSNITGSVSAVASNTSFEISLDGTTFSTNPTPISFSTGSPVTIYVRATSSAPGGSISGNVTLSATGVASKVVTLAGTVGAGSKDSVKFAFSLTSHTVPSGYTAVFGDPSTGVRTATGGVLNTITISSVATNHWSALSGSSAYDIDGLLGSTVPGMPDSLLQRGWYMYSAVPGGLQSDSATLGLGINQLLITGLNPAATYTIAWSASLDASRFGLVCQNKLRIAGLTMYISPLLQESNNISQPTTPQFTTVSPDASGNLKVYIFTEAASELAILAALTIKQN